VKRAAATNPEIVLVVCSFSGGPRETDLPLPDSYDGGRRLTPTLRTARAILDSVTIESGDSSLRPVRAPYARLVLIATILGSVLLGGRSFAAIKGSCCEPTPTPTHEVPEVHVRRVHPHAPQTLEIHADVQPGVDSAVAWRTTAYDSLLALAFTDVLTLASRCSLYRSLRPFIAPLPPYQLAVGATVPPRLTSFANDIRLEYTAIVARIPSSTAIARTTIDWCDVDYGFRAHFPGAWPITDTTAGTRAALQSWSELGADIKPDRVRCITILVTINADLPLPALKADAGVVLALEGVLLHTFSQMADAVSTSRWAVPKSRSDELARWRVARRAIRGDC